MCLHNPSLFIFAKEEEEAHTGPPRSIFISKDWKFPEHIRSKQSQGSVRWLFREGYLDLLDELKS